MPKSKPDEPDPATQNLNHAQAYSYLSRTYIVLSYAANASLAAS